MSFGIFSHIFEDSREKKVMGEGVRDQRAILNSTPLQIRT